MTFCKNDGHTLTEPILERIFSEKHYFKKYVYAYICFQKIISYRWHFLPKRNYYLLVIFQMEVEKRE
jgi:hypothetical protein